MKVLQIANYVEGAGGISSQVELYATNLQKEGICCKIISTKGSVLKRLKVIVSLLRISKNFDVFHIHACSNIGFFPAVVGISLGRLLNKKILLTYHGGDAEAFFSKHRHLVRLFLLKTDHNIVLSGFLGSVFDKYGIPYTIIPNIVKFRPELFKARDIIAPNFICIRSLRPIYNQECILKAYQIVKQVYPSASLTFLGDGIDRSKLEALVSSNAIDNVRFVGRVPNSEIPSYLNKADIMLSSPVIDNMPVSLLEGFNSGLLVISSNVGGVPYMVKSGVNGLLFKSNDSRDLADKMLYACSHQDESKDMIRNAFHSMNNYSWQYVRNSYLSLCQN